MSNKNIKMNIHLTLTKWGITLRTFRCRSLATCPTNCSIQTKIGQSNRIYQSQEFKVSITHIHPQLISRYNRHAPDPVPLDQGSVEQHERVCAHNQVHTITGSRRPHDHQKCIWIQMSREHPGTRKSTVHTSTKSTCRVGDHMNTKIFARPRTTHNHQKRANNGNRRQHEYCSSTNGKCSEDCTSIR